MNSSEACTAGVLALLCMLLPACTVPDGTGPVSATKAEAESDKPLFLALQALSPRPLQEAAPALKSAGTFGFLPYVSYPIGDWRDSTNSVPETVAIGDVTGDGRNDVIMITLRNVASPLLEIDQKVFVYEQNDRGTLNPPRLYPYTEGLFERPNDIYFNATLALADMNSDGTKDILVGYGKGIKVLLSGPAGLTARTFLMAPEWRNLYPASDNYYARQLVVLDINRDGHQDMLLFNQQGAATAFFGDGQGGVSASGATLHEVRYPDDATVADYDGDGWLDVAVLAGARPVRTFWIAHNNGTRGFGQIASYWMKEDETYGSIAMGDWNGDTRTDVAVSVPKNIQTYGWPAGVLIFEQDQAGQLAAPYSIPTTHIPLALVSTDLDGDRREDLITEHNGWGQIGYLLQAHGGLQPELLVRAGVPGFNTRPIAVGDINSDGCKDMVMADRSDGLGVLIAQNCKVTSRVMSSPLPARVQR